MAKTDDVTPPMADVQGGVLLLFHCPTNTGYAIEALERTFHSMALRLTRDERQVFYGYPSLDGGHPSHLPDNFSRVYLMNSTASDPKSLADARDLVRRSDIRLVFAFDLRINAPLLGALRAGGARAIISYWGASISSPYPWWLRPVRKVQYLMARNRPDHFIFESDGMRYGATHGSMIPREKTTVCRLGVDTERFAPRQGLRDYAYEQLGIPKDRKIVFFSGHMERRKGVHILVEALAQLINERGRRDIQLVVLGNRPGQETALADIVAGTPAQAHLTFGGYRTDIAMLHQSVYLGAIASTGWDSFTMSAVEMAASGIPLLVSDLPGLRETVVEDTTGHVIAAGDVNAWAAAIGTLVDQPQVRERLSLAARERAVAEFSLEQQVNALARTVRSVWERRLA